MCKIPSWTQSRPSRTNGPCGGISESCAGRAFYHCDVGATPHSSLVGNKISTASDSETSANFKGPSSTAKLGSGHLVWLARIRVKLLKMLKNSKPKVLHRDWLIEHLWAVWCVGTLHAFGAVISFLWAECGRQRGVWPSDVGPQAAISKRSFVVRGYWGAFSQTTGSMGHAWKIEFADIYSQKLFPHQTTFCTVTSISSELLQQERKRVPASSVMSTVDNISTMLLSGQSLRGAIHAFLSPCAQQRWYDSVPRVLCVCVNARDDEIVAKPPPQ